VENYQRRITESYGWKHQKISGNYFQDPLQTSCPNFTSSNLTFPFSFLQISFRLIPATHHSYSIGSYFIFIFSLFNQFGIFPVHSNPFFFLFHILCTYAFISFCFLNLFSSLRSLFCFILFCFSFCYSFLSLPLPSSYTFPYFFHIIPLIRKIETQFLK